jgi:hypothetical protein
MTVNNVAQSTPMCPSAQRDWQGSRAFGVIVGSVDQPRVQYLEYPLPSDDPRLDTGNVKATEVIRFAAPCAGCQCAQHEEGACGLAKRAVQHLPVVVRILPKCGIRQDCLWWRQEGREACYRCPQVVTENRNDSQLLRQVVGAAGVQLEPTGFK